MIYILAVTKYLKENLTIFVGKKRLVSDVPKKFLVIATFFF